ncbi:MAG TPA: hypothetical protein VJ226_14215 [Bradyrhizobium sp.]|nr:hypothetical protein [Bradyrhizobium sp.]
MNEAAVAADLIAVLVAVTECEPRVMTVGNGNALPSGPLEPDHRSLQSGLRAWVEQQTRHPLGYVEQLYTFADRDRTGEHGAQHVISISYLGLTREGVTPGTTEPGWFSWYEYFPWEDHRTGRPGMIAKILAPALRAWAKAATDAQTQRARRQRAAINFGLDDHDWNEDLVLQRYELLYEAALVDEALRGRGGTARIPGRSMSGDHRRILATGIARLRAKIKYRPVVFELMPQRFTLLQLQRTVEALAGRLVHKQNFRRLIEQQALVEAAGATASDSVGRPAKLFRFRHAVLAERAFAGTKLPLART